MPCVLHVAQPTDGGVATYVAWLAGAQRHHGDDVVVACPDGELVDWLAAAQVTRRRWPAVRSPARNLVSEWRSLRAIVAEVDPDLVHLHSSKAGLVGRAMLRGRRPTLFQPHGWSWLAVSGAEAIAARRWERLAARWCDRLVCVSTAERAMGMASGVAAGYAVVRTGVDRVLFGPADDADRRRARARLGLDDSPLAVCVGRLTRAKGQDRLVALWPEVRREVPSARLLLVGGGDLTDAVRGLAGEGVELAGPRTDVRDWYAAADVVVVPSRWDALSLSLLEACAVGSSIVATDVPGAHEVLDPVIPAAVVAADDDRALVAAVVMRLVDTELVEHERSLTAAHAAAELDDRVSFAAMQALVADVAAERSAGAAHE